jgi:hypothetical protein
MSVNILVILFPTSTSNIRYYHAAAAAKNGGYMKRKLLLYLLLSVTAFVAAGCGEAAVNKEAFASVKYAGILSLTVKRSGPYTAGNEEVMQAVANYALGQAESQLKNVRSFKLVPASALYKTAEYINAGTVLKATGALNYLKNNPDSMNRDTPETRTSGDFMTALKTGLRAAADASAINNDPAGTAQKRLDEYRTRLTCAAGLPFIPYGVINNVQPGATVSYVNGVRQGGGNEGLKQMMIEEAKAVCAKTRLDAVILVYVDTAADTPKGVYLITGGNRVAGTIRLNMTMLMISKKGEVIADLDWPSMDDLAPMKLAQPASIVTQWYTPGKSVKQTAIDLKDPSGVVLNAYKELTVDSTGRMVNNLKKAIGEIE